MATYKESCAKQFLPRRGFTKWCKRQMNKLMRRKLKKAKGEANLDLSQWADDELDTWGRNIEDVPVKKNTRGWTS